MSDLLLLLNRMLHFAAPSSIISSFSSLSTSQIRKVEEEREEIDNSPPPSPVMVASTSRIFNQPEILSLTEVAPLEGGGTSELTGAPSF